MKNEELELQVVTVEEDLKTAQEKIMEVYERIHRNLDILLEKKRAKLRK